MRILIISDAQGLDGAQGMLRFATRYWKLQLGWEIDVFQPRRQVGQDLLLDAGMNPISEITQALSYNLVLVNSFLNIDYLARFTNVPVVFWVHEARVVLWGSQIPIASLMQLFARPNRIIFQTAYQANAVFKSFIHELPPERIVIIPNGLEPVQIQLAKKQNDGVLRLSWLGSVMSRKRPADLVNAVLALSAEFPIEAQLIGSLGDAHTLGKEFEGFIQSPPNNIAFTGGLSRQAALQAVANTDIFCQTSADESFALGPLEAAALGLPVILSDLPILKFIGWKHGENCLLYPPGDVTALAQCIRELRNNSSLRVTFAIRGRALADLYQGDLFLSRITEVIKTLATA